MTDTAAMNTSSAPSPIAVTMGDAAGVGPELCLKLLNETSFAEHSVPVIIGSAKLLERAAKQTGIPFKAEVFEKFPVAPHVVKVPSVWDHPQAFGIAEVMAGRNQQSCGKASALFIQTAAKACQDGLCAAMVTAPISKKSLELAGINFPGHTEYIAHLTGSPRVAMLLYSPKLAVAFATSHQSLRSVPDSLNGDRIVEVATLLNLFLKRLRNGDAPRLAILGLNPHAGEEGLFGSEDQQIIAPAVMRLRSLGINAEGPLPPDTAFTPHALGKFHGHVALYHDQGGIPFKMCSFDTGANVTLGLDIIRTSPDHGTAFDIAWQGKADTGSFFAAYALAARLARPVRGNTGSNRTPAMRLTPVNGVRAL